MSDKWGCCSGRHVKCDEARPECRRCTMIGLICEGYEDSFHVRTVSPSKEQLGCLFNRYPSISSSQSVMNNKIDAANKQSREGRTAKWRSLRSLALAPCSSRESHLKPVDNPEIPQDTNRASEQTPERSLGPDPMPVFGANAKLDNAQCLEPKQSVLDKTQRATSVLRSSVTEQSLIKTLTLRSVNISPDDASFHDMLDYCK